MFQQFIRQTIMVNNPDLKSVKKKLIQFCLEDGNTNLSMSLKLE